MDAILLVIDVHSREQIVKYLHICHPYHTLLFTLISVNGIKLNVMYRQIKPLA